MHRSVQASLTNSHELSALCMGLLEQSLQGPARLSLEEDGMILWQAMLRHTSRLDAQLVQLAPVAINQLSSDPDSLLRCLQIVDSYVLLDGAQLYQARRAGRWRPLSYRAELTMNPFLRPSLRRLLAHTRTVWRPRRPRTSSRRFNRWPSTSALFPYLAGERPLSKLVRRARLV